MLADAIAGLLDDPDRRARYGTRSRELFDQGFTLDRSTEQMAALYARIAGQAGVSAAARVVHAPEGITRS
jgi:glycosyltransferase involved in cell wall biosynthesis